MYEILEQSEGKVIRLRVRNKQGMDEVHRVDVIEVQPEKHIDVRLLDKDSLDVLRFKFDHEYEYYTADLLGDNLIIADVGYVVWASEEM